MYSFSQGDLKGTGFVVFSYKHDSFRVDCPVTLKSSPQLCPNCKPQPKLFQQPYRSVFN